MKKNLLLFAVITVLMSAVFSCSSSKVIYVTMTPKSHNFGQVNISVTETFDFVIMNKKKVDITLTGIAFLTGEFSEITGALGQTVLANKGTRTLTVRFSPAMPGGLKSDTMTIDWVDLNAKSGKIEVKLEGEAVPVPIINVTPANHNFGNVMTGTSTTQDFTIENTGTADLSIFAPSFSGAGAGSYSLTAGGAGGTVNPGNTLLLTVTFAPTSDGNKVAELEIPHNAINTGTPLNVALEGVGVTPMIACTPNPLDFQNVALGGIEIMNLDVDNAGTGNLQITAVNFSGINAAEFVLMAHLPINVNPGNILQVPIMFIPGAVGQRGPVTATFVNNTGTPEDVDLYGEGERVGPLLNENFDGNTAPSNWRFNGGVWNWGTPTSGPGRDHTTGSGKCIATNVSGNYSNNMRYGTDYAESPAVDLRGTSSPQLSFWNWHSIESYFDRAYLMISTNNGASWTQLLTFDNTITTWTKRDFDLTPYRTSSQFKVRWAFNSDASVIRPGWYIDDVMITDGSTPPLPDIPSSPSPSDNATGIPAGGTTLSWTSNGTQYDVYLDTVNPPLNVLASNHTSQNISSGTLSGGTTYYWRVIAKNTTGKVLGPVWSFTTN